MEAMTEQEIQVRKRAIEAIKAELATARGVHGSDFHFFNAKFTAKNKAINNDDFELAQAINMISSKRELV